MYLEHFGLGVNPFSLSPKLDFLYKSGTFEESMAHLIYGLDNQEAIVLITGTIGTGKTMAIQSFLSNLGPRFEFALVTNTRVTGTELLKLILEDLDVTFPVGADKSDLLILFKDFLHEAYRNGRRVLLVVDEAQNLAPEVLEEIRLLTNLGQGDVQPVQIILVGQPELEETVNRDDLAQIRQRIRVHYNLDPMDRRETEEYLDHRMAVGGCSRKVFSQSAVDRIYTVSRGIPRLVNTLAGDALLSAFVAGRDMVQAGDVEEDEDRLRSTAPAAPATVKSPTSPAGPEVDSIGPSKAAASVTPPLPPPVEGEEDPFREVLARIEPVQSPPPAAGSYAQRRPKKNRSLLPVGLLVVLLAVVGALYSFGYLDGVLGAITGQSSPEVRADEMGTQVAKPVVQPPAVTPESGSGEVPEEGDGGTMAAESNIQESVESGEGSGEENPGAITQDSGDPGSPAGDETETTPEPAVETVTTPPATAESTGTAVEDDRFFIHIYSFRTPERANSLVRRWDHPEDSLSIVAKEIRGVTWHRVYLGPYPSRNEALMVALRLKQDGHVSYYKVVGKP